MALNDNEIKDILRGDLPDTDELNDEGDYDEEINITQRITKMAEFINNNNAERNYFKYL